MSSRGSKRRTSLVEMTVVKVTPYLRPEKPLLWLAEKEAAAPRLLPIAIGEFEAAAIQMQLGREHPLRPISYDLFSSMLERLDVPVRRVFIHSVEQQTFHAVLVIEREGRLCEVDCRPSDGVALVLRAGAPIFVAGDLLDLVGVSTEPRGDIDEALNAFYELEPQIVPAHPEARPPGQPAGEAPAEVAAAESEDALARLQSQLERAVICEQYEEAAQLRDEIARRLRRPQT
ncbi:MAG: bifunctional nuclease family protein [Gemmatimonadota bacterium]